MTDRWRPPAPPSGQTMVGMGAVEARGLAREEAVTPPRGSEDIGDPLRAGDVSLLLGELRRLGEKQDATIDDVRALALEVRRAREATASAERLGEAVFGLLPLPRLVSELVEAVRALDARIGRPPSAEDFARASHADATPEELARLEEAARLGTGIWRFVMDLHLRSSRHSARAAGVAAGVSGSGGAVVGAVLAELARLLF